MIPDRKSAQQTRADHRRIAMTGKNGDRSGHENFNKQRPRLVLRYVRDRQRKVDGVALAQASSARRARQHDHRDGGADEAAPDASSWRRTRLQRCRVLPIQRKARSQVYDDLDTRTRTSHGRCHAADEAPPVARRTPARVLPAPSGYSSGPSNRGRRRRSGTRARRCPRRIELTALPVIETPAATCRSTPTQRDLVTDGQISSERSVQRASARRSTSGSRSTADRRR